MNECRRSTRVHLARVDAQVSGLQGRRLVEGRESRRHVERPPRDEPGLCYRLGTPKVGNGLASRSKDLVRHCPNTFRLPQVQYWDMAGGEFCAQAGKVHDMPGAVTAVLPNHLTVVA